MMGYELNLVNMMNSDDASDNGDERLTSKHSNEDLPQDVTHASGEQVKVEIVVQFFKVGEIDTLKEQFNADVIVKAKWREPTLDGQQTTVEAIDFARLWSPKLYIENSLGDPKEQIRHRIIYNDKGEAYIYEKRVAKGTFMENLELDDFPFDVQDLTITVASELPISECELIEDKEEHHVVNRQSFVDEQEWHLYVHTECNKKELVIDQVDNSVKRSALSVKCRAARRPGYFVWNIFMITFLICSLAFATFSVDKDLPQNRLQLSFTLVLTAVAFKSVVNSSLPRISYLTYMDKYLLVSMVMLSAVCTWHAIVTRLNHNRPYADKVENIVLTILSILYIIYNIGFIVMIYLFPCKKRRIMSQKDREYKMSDRYINENLRSKVQEETETSSLGTKRQYKDDIKILTPNGTVGKKESSKEVRNAPLQTPALTREGAFYSDTKHQNGFKKTTLKSNDDTIDFENDLTTYNESPSSMNGRSSQEGELGPNGINRNRGRKGSLPVPRLISDLKRMNKAYVSPTMHPKADHKDASAKFQMTKR